MALNFDVELFCENLRATKPPYECPVKTCSKIYKSFAGIQLHVHSHKRCSEEDSMSDMSGLSTIKTSSVVSSAVKQSGRTRQQASVENNRSASSIGSSRIVEVEVSSGHTVKVDVRAPLNIFIRHDEGCGYGANCEITLGSKHSPTSLKETGKSKKEVAAPVSSGSKCSTTAAKHLEKSHKESAAQGTRLPEASYRVMDDYVKRPNIPLRPTHYYKFTPKTVDELDKEVDYDMDEMDSNWLRLVNEKRRKYKLTPVPKELFEQLMDGFEKESYFQPIIEEGYSTPADEDAICCICLDGECPVHNVILFCDLCNLAVHQECYGVPTVPDGPWLCRRCLLSPSRAVPCCLCPSLRGAFKQTDDGRWAHVVCALWIPAVGFANGVFLEPIDSINRIAPARWKLTCFICKRRGVGACIQCHKPSCYTAFHVTCALQAGLHMKLEKIRDTGGLAQGSNGSQAPNFKKCAYCDVHTPASLETSGESGTGDKCLEGKSDLNVDVHTKLLKNIRETRRLLTEKAISGPVLSVPVVSPNSVSKLTARVKLDGKKEFVERLHSYWTLKRDSFNGVSLITMTATNVTRCQARESVPVVSDQSHQDQANQAALADSKAPVGTVQSIRKLRQQMEKVRLLLELVKKRERMKLEQVKQYEAVIEMRLRPLTVLLRRALQQIESSGENGRLSDLWRKLNQYKSVDEFEEDFNLVMASLLEVSKHHGGIHKTVTKIRDQGTEVIEGLRCVALSIGFDKNTGLHLPLVNGRPIEQPLSPALIDHFDSTGDQSLTSVADEDDPVSMPCGVNRRTMILFSKKAKQRRLSAIQLAAGKDSLQALLPENAELDNELETNCDAIKLPPQDLQNFVEASDVSLVANSILPRPPAKRKHAVHRVRAHRNSKQNDYVELMDSKLRSKKLINADDAKPPSESQVKGETVISDDLPRIAAAENFECRARDAAELAAHFVSNSSRRGAAHAASCDTGNPVGEAVFRAASDGARNTLRRAAGSTGTEYRHPAQGAMGTKAYEDSGSAVSSTAGSEAPDDSRSAVQGTARTKDPKDSRNCVRSSTVTKGPADSGSAIRGSLDNAWLCDLLLVANQISPVANAISKVERSAFSPLDVVWAKCRGFPSYPAMVIDPRPLKNLAGGHNGLNIPLPPEQVVRPYRGKMIPSDMVLVVFFDVKHTWQWLHCSALQPLGTSSDIDSTRLSAPMKPSMRKAIRIAYDRALLRLSVLHVSSPSDH